MFLPLEGANDETLRSSFQRATGSSLEEADEKTLSSSFKGADS